jgi:glycosyltransferase involved in cell wall biosynthesis
VENKLLVTVVTVCFNSAKTITQTLESVACQTHQDIEHLIIDGGSTDGTLQILSSWCRHPLKVISERDKGIYDAMNKGLSTASGEAIGFLNSDDRFNDESVVARIAYFFSSGDVDCVYGNLVMSRWLGAAPSDVLRQSCNGVACW